MENLVLEICNIKKSFGGISVLKGVNFNLKESEFKSIIGPNGAGKTTLFNVICGLLKPNDGKVIFKGAEITEKNPNVIASMGLSRSFQITNLFPTLTVHENLRIAAQSKGSDNIKIFSSVNNFGTYIKLANEILELVRLEGKGHLIAAQLSHTEQRKLELGILLAMGGDVILLDEPTAGVSLEEVHDLLNIMKDIKFTKGKSILLIEHKINIVMGISNTIAVLQNGEIIADGTPAEIRENQNVQDAYFGGGIKHE